MIGFSEFLFYRGGARVLTEVASHIYLIRMVAKGGLAGTDGDASN